MKRLLIIAMVVVGIVMLNSCGSVQRQSGDEQEETTVPAPRSRSTRAGDGDAENGESAGTGRGGTAGRGTTGGTAGRGSTGEGGTAGRGTTGGTAGRGGTTGGTAGRGGTTGGTAGRGGTTGGTTGRGGTTGGTAGAGQAGTGVICTPNCPCATGWAGSSSVGSSLSPTPDATGLVLTGAERYVVVSGDTLTSIAQSKYQNGFYYPLIMMASSNVIRNQDLIYPGQILSIPNLQDNLNDPEARAAVKAYIAQVADHQQRSSRFATARGLQNLSDSL